MSPEHRKDYYLLSWLDFGTWDLTATKMILKFIGQMVRAPRGSFLAELLAELRRDCERSYDAMMHSFSVPCVCFVSGYLSTVLSV